MKKARFLSILLISFMVLFCSGCSQVLNMALIPFAPDFVPSINFTSQGAEISFSMSSEISYSKNDKETWDRDYAVYIWRSTVSPYQDYELLQRIYINGAPGEYKSWSNYKGKYSETKHDYTLPNDGINTDYSYSGGKYIDSMPSTGTTCYYRVSKIKLKCSHSKSDDSESISYSLPQKTSGWISSSPKSE